MVSKEELQRIHDNPDYCCGEITQAKFQALKKLQYLGLLTFEHKVAEGGEIFIVSGSLQLTDRGKNIIS